MVLALDPFDQVHSTRSGGTLLTSAGHMTETCLNACREHKRRHSTTFWTWPWSPQNIHNLFVTFMDLHTLVYHHSCHECSIEESCFLRHLFPFSIPEIKMIMHTYIKQATSHLIEMYISDKARLLFISCLWSHFIPESASVGTWPLNKGYYFL